MLSGDVAGSWQVIEAAMASGLEPAIYVRVLAPSLHAIGALWDRVASPSTRSISRAVWPRR